MINKLTEINEEEIIIPLYNSSSAPNDQEKIQNYWILEIKPNTEIKKNAYISYNKQTYVVEHIDNYASHLPPSYRLYMQKL